MNEYLCKEMQKDIENKIFSQRCMSKRSLRIALGKDGGVREEPIQL
jgi:hypothetical protein